MQEVGIIKYNAGNVFSVSNALERLNVKHIVTDDLKILESLDKIIFPGVGEAQSAMVYLKERGLDTLIKSLRQPVLGICLGMQIMCKQSEEQNTECLNIFDVKVKKFINNKGLAFKVPHVGWNTINQLSTPLFDGILDQSHFYFVHSYYAEQNDYSIASCNYSEKFSAAIQKDNFYGVQFHPEKSAKFGEKLIKNFLNL